MSSLFHNSLVVCADYYGTSIQPKSKDLLQSIDNCQGFGMAKIRRVFKGYRTGSRVVRTSVDPKRSSWSRTHRQSHRWRWPVSQSLLVAENWDWEEFPADEISGDKTLKNWEECRTLFWAFWTVWGRVKLLGDCLKKRLNYVEWWNLLKVWAIDNDFVRLRSPKRPLRTSIIGGFFPLEINFLHNFHKNWNICLEHSGIFITKRLNSGEAIICEINEGNNRCRNKRVLFRFILRVPLATSNRFWGRKWVPENSIQIYETCFQTRFIRTLVKFKVNISLLLLFQLFQS